jgi:hypothetical protein
MIVVAIGSQGSGKTHALCVELQKLYAKRCSEGLNPHVFVHDRRCYWPAGRLPGRPLARGGGVIQDRTIGALVPPGNWYAGPGDWLADEHRPRIAGFHMCPPTEVLSLGKDCCDRRIPAILCIDELDQLPPIIQQQCPDAYWVAHYGRRIPVDVLGSARRPQNLDKVWVADAAILLLFRLSEPRATSYLQEANITEQDLRAVLPSLEPRYHLRIENLELGDPS